MKYEVFWTAQAEQALADLWLQPRLRAHVDAAVRQLELILRTSPTTAGESRDLDIRILFVRPLAVLFDLGPEPGEVRVWKLWRCSRKSER